MAKENKDLETALKEKVEPLLEETMEKHWGITIPKIEADISDKLKQGKLSIYIPVGMDFNNSKKKIKKEFFKKEIQTHKGNISQLAKVLNIDRRSIHRTIKDLDIDVKELRSKPMSDTQYQEEMVSQTIKSTFEQYKEILQPEKIEKVYEDLKDLSRNIARSLPKEDLTWKDAEKEFEKQFLEQALLENSWNISQTAKQIKIRAETLHRKIKKLGLI